MNYPLPHGVVNTDSMYYYVQDGANPLGPLVKQPSDQTLVILDYGPLTTAITITSYTFTPDVSSNPSLVVSFPQLDALERVLTFLLSGGLAGQQYMLAVTVQYTYLGGSAQRVDTLTVNIPSSGSACEIVNPLPEIYNQAPLGTFGYVNTGIRLFWSAAAPANPNALDQWYKTDTDELFEWVTDGTTYFWETIASPDFMTEAPNDGFNYVRYANDWTRSAIQADAPSNPQAYVRKGGNWDILDHSDISDWSDFTPAGSNTVPLMDGVANAGVSALYSRADHIHPSDTSKVGEAPNDGKQYARQNQAWSQVSGGGGSNSYMELLAVTSTNVIAPVSLTPGGGMFMLLVNGVALTPAEGSFTVSGKTITWTSTDYSVHPGDSVVAVYSVDSAVTHSMEVLSVLSTNHVSGVTYIPRGDLFLLLINGISFTPAEGSFTLSGKTIIWASTDYSINIGDSVVAVYSYIG